jgi:hypothetical protein
LYKLTFYVPETHVEQVKDAVFAAGAGRYENYDRCSWQTLGTGQFRPKEDARPFLGSQGVEEHVTEAKVEMVCGSDCILAAVEALVAAHPYEEPAYDATPIVKLEDLTGGPDA